MQVLLDTHALVWFLSGDKQLSAAARAVIEDENNPVLVSIACLWEIAIKASLGKLLLTDPFSVLFPAELANNGIDLLGISVAHTTAVASLPFHHRDPFDRLLVAQAIVERLAVVSADTMLDRYGVSRTW